MAWWWCRRRRRRRCSTRRPRAKQTKARSARSWPRACWAWTCTTCASRCNRPGCATSIDTGRMQRSWSKQITGISSMATRQVLAELVEELRAAVGAAGDDRVGRRRDAARRVQDGEAFDIVVLAADAIERLAAAGRDRSGQPGRPGAFGRRDRGGGRARRGRRSALRRRFATPFWPRAASAIRRARAACT